MTTPNSASSSPLTTVLTILRRYWLPLVIGILVIIFITQNRAQTRTQMLWLSFDSPLWLTLTVVSVIALGCGYFIGKRRAKAQLAAKAK